MFAQAPSPCRPRRSLCSLGRVAPVDGAPWLVAVACGGVLPRRFPLLADQGMGQDGLLFCPRWPLGRAVLDTPTRGARNATPLAGNTVPLAQQDGG